jgi:rhodanese-related sulfurtransferase
MDTPQTSTYPRSFLRLAIALVIVGAALPLALYRFYWGPVPTVLPAEAKELLRVGRSATVLVDVRSRSEFDRHHVDGACNWPLSQILTASSPNDVPVQLAGKRLLLICTAGISSRTAVLHLRKLGLAQIMNVRGGMIDWIADVSGRRGDVLERFRTGLGDTLEFPFQPMPLYQQVLAVAGAYAIKPAYTLLALVLVIILWRRTVPDLAALRWGLLFFFLGENCCAINYIFFKHTSYFFEYLHSYGMLLAFGFITFAVFEGVDRRILMLSDPSRKCAALSLCRGCIKYTRRSCGLRQTFFLIIPALIVLAAIPLCSDWQTNSYNTMILGSFYNYSHPAIQQQLEVLYCPTAAIVMLAASLLVLWFSKQGSLAYAKLAFAAGAGFLGFALLRAALFRLFASELMWALFWEEATELLFIIGVGAVLWIFRQGLSEEPRTHDDAEGEKSS